MVDPYSLYSATKSLDPTSAERLAELSDRNQMDHFDVLPDTSFDELVQKNNDSINESGAWPRAEDWVSQGDGLNDNIDTDCDNDGLPNKLDTDFDNDGINDRMDTDMDNDSIPNKLDRDFDNDGINDKIDTDLDNDGLSDRIDRDRH